jgi:hypothetical protein
MNDNGMHTILLIRLVDVGGTSCCALMLITFEAQGVGGGAIGVGSGISSIS